jgi:hypothetical protein
MIRDIEKGIGSQTWKQALWAISIVTTSIPFFLRWVVLCDSMGFCAKSIL